MMVISPQNGVEFWGVATRPVPDNGLGMGPSRADQALQKFENLFDFAQDSPGVYQEWRRLVVNHNVRGRQVHDARLVAVMLAHGVTHLLTFHTGDFQRYPGITVVHPRDVPAVP
jgi:predicted nucleic acid-binding protein